MSNLERYSITQLQRIGTDMLRHVASICEEEDLHYCLFFGSMLGAVRHHGPIPWDYDIDIAVHENDMDRFITIMEEKLPHDYWVDFRSKYDTPKCLARIGLRGFDTRSLHIDVYRMVGFPDSIKKSRVMVKIGRILLAMRIVKDANLNYYYGEKKKKIQLYRKILLPVSTRFIVTCFDALCKMYPYDKMNKVGLNACKLGIKYIYNKETIDDTILVDYADFKVRIPKSYDAILTSLYKDYMKYPDQDKIDKALYQEYVLYKLDMD